MHAWNNKGNALDKLGKYEEAIRCYDKAIGIDPNDAMSYNKLKDFFILERLEKKDRVEL